MGSHAPGEDLVPAKLDTARRWVRVTGERRGGFIEFDFAIGEPELFVEMILQKDAFDEFCAANRVQRLAPADEASEAPDDWQWRLADATGTRFKPR